MLPKYRSLVNAATEDRVLHHHHHPILDRHRHHHHHHHHHHPHHNYHHELVDVKTRCAINSISGILPLQVRSLSANLFETRDYDASVVSMPATADAQIHCLSIVAQFLNGRFCKILESTSLNRP